MAERTRDAVFHRTDGPAPASLSDEIARQQRIHLIAQIPIMSAVNVMAGAVMAGILWIETGPFWAAGWYGPVLLLSTLQFAGWLRVRGRPAPARTSGRTLRSARFWALIMGLLWGVSAALLFGTGLQNHLFMALVLVGMAAGTVTLLAPLPSVCWRFLAGVMLPAFLSMAALMTPLAAGVAVLQIVFVFALMKAAYRARDQFAELVRASYEQARAEANLIDALESTRDAFALFDEEGRPVLTNARFRAWFDGAKGRAFPADARDGAILDVPGGWAQLSMRPTRRKGHVAVLADVTALKARERDLESARAQAEEANRAKSDFLANMSHELRTPLNAIIGFSEMMQTQVFGPLGHERYAGYAEDIHRSAHHLLSLIGDILDLSKIEAARYELQPEAIDLKETIDWVVTLAGQQARGLGRAPVDVELSGDLAPLQADSRALRQVLLNLLSNAVKFTPPERRVGIRAEAAIGHVRITVWDEGIGIPADKIDLVLQPFRQAENALDKRYEGTGLGLAICDALVRLHGGALAIESAEGAGTRVTVTLPRIPDVPAAAEDTARDAA